MTLAECMPKPNAAAVFLCNSTHNELIQPTGNRHRGHQSPNHPSQSLPKPSHHRYRETEDAGPKANSSDVLERLEASLCTSLSTPQRTTKQLQGAVSQKRGELWGCERASCHPRRS